jgi:hypothetical protein
MIAVFAFGLITGDTKGIVISLFPVTAFVAIYLNWISKKFFLNS